MPRARRPALVLATALAVLLALVLAAVAFDAFTGRQIRDVADPPDDATPEQVVAAYLEALDADDCETAAALRTPESTDVALAWCKDVGSLRNVEIQEHDVEEPSWSGHSPGTQVVNVGVDVDVDWRPFRSDNMSEEAMSWGYLLVRDTDVQPWRIFDEGVG